QMAGKWQQRFPKKQPLELELGSGKGKFILEKAQQNPQTNFIAMEIQTAALGMILKQQVELKLPNLQLLQANGRELVNLFSPNEIQKLYLNFSDPWPKTRHTKRRLTAPNFLEQYQTILSPQGEIEFKTDNKGLF
ncbi:tRNA (guanosine(46)-N7)-methyltransferase TrmB, partial [Lactobacillus sp. XV13L]|nr:tRNA (guanosine(46)-N7)-methyltransferase TrmB [Lactobacillus sp. XV13L]